MLEDGGDSKDGVLADVGMAMLEAGASGRQEWLYEFRFAELAQETECVAADVFIGMLKVHADAVATSGVSVLYSHHARASPIYIPYENHLLL